MKEFTIKVPFTTHLTITVEGSDYDDALNSIVDESYIVIHEELGEPDYDRIEVLNEMDIGPEHDEIDDMRDMREEFEDGLDFPHSIRSIKDVD